MASTNIVKIYVGVIDIEAGNGAPDHAGKKGTQYTDVDAPNLYQNTDGSTAWELIGTQS